MSQSTQSFYIYTTSGNALLVEIFENDGNVSIFFGNKRLEISRNSAFELADALLMVASDA